MTHAAAQYVVSRLIERPVLRLSLGRWPEAHEVLRFRRAFCERAPLPPLLRGLATITDVRHRLTACLHPSHTARHVPPALAFMHIEKTAGSSVVAYLSDLYPDDLIDPDPLRGAPGHILQPVPGSQRAYALAHGHYDLPALLRGRSERKLLAFFRCPDQRILSLYNYWRAIKPEEIEGNGPHPGMVAARSRSLLDFLRSSEPEVLDFIDNVYARRLTGLYLSATDPVPPDAVWLDRSLSALDQLDCVGIAERMSESLQRLGRHLGTPPPGVIPHVNRLSDMVLDRASAFDRQQPPALGMREREALIPLVRLDWPIYQAVCARFEAEQELTNFMKEDSSARNAAAYPLKDAFEIIPK